MIIFFRTADDSASKVLNGLQFSNILICGTQLCAQDAHDEETQF